MPESRPNLLLITSDQQHWDTLGITNPEVGTPNLDRLAESGTRFTRAYCPNPTCTPTRASIITGRYPSQHGAWALGTKLPESEPTLGETLQEAGYHTALIGKAHFQPLLGTEAYPSLEAYPILQDLDFWRGFNGPFYGFEHVELARNHVDEAHIGQHYALWMEAQGCSNWRDYFQPPTGNNPDQRWTWQIPEEFHYNTWIAERTNALLESYHREGRPFFLWASFFDPHPPYLVPEPWDRMYDLTRITVPCAVEGEHALNPPHFQLTQEPNPDFSRYLEPDGHACHGFHSHLQDRAELAQDTAVYYGMVSLLDKYVGRILDQLDGLGLTEHTVVVFTSDHGHFYGQHGLIRKGPFHYEDMIRVPFIVSCPDTIPGGIRSDALQSLVDLPPTFLSFAGIDIPRTMTSVDQKDIWCGGEASRRDHVIVENRHQPTTVHLKTFVNQRYKLTVYYNQAYGELFDLQEDPQELHNRWSDPDYGNVKTELLLRFLHAEMGKEPLWMPRIAVA
jgi:arylsulfatase A-like enzyme